MPEIDHDIELGDRVKDKISGFTGIVTTVGYHLTGCTRFGVYPAGDGEETVQRGEEEFFYEDQLELVNGEAFKGVETTDPEDIDIELGALAKDDVTGYMGFVVMINTKLWNCPQVALQRETADDGEGEPEAWMFDLPRISVVDDGVSDRYQSLQEAEAQKATGSMVGSAKSLQEKRDR